MQVDRKEAKRTMKSKALVELQRQRQMDVSDDELMENAEVRDKVSESENDEDLEEERMIAKLHK